MTNPTPRDESASDNEKGQEQKPFNVADRWWWSGTFRAVLGVVIAYLQWGPISEGIANWMNWVMVAVGIAVAIWGVVDLIRDYEKHTKAN